MSRNMAAFVVLCASLAASCIAPYVSRTFARGTVGAEATVSIEFVYRFSHPYDVVRFDFDSEENQHVVASLKNRGDDVLTAARNKNATFLEWVTLEPGATRVFYEGPMPRLYAQIRGASGRYPMTLTLDLVRPLAKPSDYRIWGFWTDGP